MQFDDNQLKGVAIKGGTLFIPPNPKSVLYIGDKHYRISLPVDQYFNWFQRVMWKWCFGIKVENYSRE